VVASRVILLFLFLSGNSSCSGDPRRPTPEAVVSSDAESD